MLGRNVTPRRTPWQVPRGTHRLRLGPLGSAWEIGSEPRRVALEVVDPRPVSDCPEPDGRVGTESEETSDRGPPRGPVALEARPPRRDERQGEAVEEAVLLGRLGRELVGRAPLLSRRGASLLPLALRERPPTRADRALDAGLVLRVTSPPNAQAR